MTKNKIFDSLKNVIDIESKSLSKLSQSIDVNYVEAINLLNDCEGKVVITGVGKSGHIGKKIAATFSSTGTPTFFVHSTEGVHGDLGMIERDDVVILISNSGETEEVLNLIPTIKEIGAKMISITSKQNSTLGENVNVSLEYNYLQEADHLQLAPTSSSTMTLVIGDALAVTLSKLKEFKKEDFHLYHPGGSLGQKLTDSE